MNPFEPICDDLAKLLWEKRQSYGANNLTGTQDFFKLLFPDGIPVERYQDALILARMFDKMSRIARGTQGNEDAWQDMAGYAVCVMELRERESRPSRPDWAYCRTCEQGIPVTVDGFGRTVCPICVSKRK